MTTRYSFGGDEHIFAEVSEGMSLEAFFKTSDQHLEYRLSGLQ